MDLTIIENLRDTTEIRMIKSNCNKILKKLSFNSQRDISNVTELTLLLYIFDMEEEALEVANILKDVEFNGNYTLWDYVADARAIAVRILRGKGLSKEADEIMESIIPHLSPELYENQKDILTSIYERNISIVRQQNWKSDVRDWKLIKLEKMICYFEAPGFPIDKDEFDKEIMELKEELRTLVK